jgi:hypothetical protein
VGESEGCPDGDGVGSAVFGVSDGVALGLSVGFAVGKRVGGSDGVFDGVVVGFEVVVVITGRSRDFCPVLLEPVATGLVVGKTLGAFD